MNPAMSWTIFFSSLVLYGALVFCHSNRRVTVLAIASFLIAAWLVGKQALTMVLCLEVLFWLIRTKAPAKNLSGFNPWTAIGVAIGLLPFFFLLAYDSASTSLGTAAIFSFFSLQTVGGFLQIWFNDEPANLKRSEWYAFSLFFPTLITGPILKWPEMREQMRIRRPFHIDDGIECLRLLTRGLFKRLIFAAPFYLVANEAVSLNTLESLPLLLLFAIVLRFAIWADISGHTDWAHGISLILGFKLPENFKRPFQTFSVLEFWRRWHISLTSWIQDYVYYPLVTSFTLRKIPRTVRIGLAILISFLALGLWHGLRSEFLLMGLLKGIGVVLSLILVRKCSGLLNKILSPFLLVGFVILPTALLKIDLNTFGNGLWGIGDMWSATHVHLTNISALLTRGGVDRNPIGWIIALAISWQFYETMESRGRRLPALVEIMILLLCILALATQGTDTRFLYVPISQ